jgi:hypothetical protein
MKYDQVRVIVFLAMQSPTTVRESIVRTPGKSGGLRSLSPDYVRIPLTRLIADGLDSESRGGYLPFTAASKEM